MQNSIVLLLLMSLTCFSASAKQTILIIESYHSEFSWDKSYISGLNSILEGKYDLFYFQMDTKRFSQSQHQLQADKAWAEYQQLQPDLVILGDDNALKYLGSRFSNTKTPVVFLGINNNPRYYKLYNSKNITGVLERPLIKRSISKIAYGNAKKVLLLFDNSHTSQTIFQEKFSSLKQRIISGVQVDIRLISTFQEWQEQVTNSTKNQYELLFIGLYHTLINENGNHIAASEVLNWTVQNTPIPPFAFWDFSIGKGKAIGGLVLFGFEQGKLAAQMAKLILETEVSPHQIGKQTAEKGRYLFSKQQLKKFSFTLPESINKKATFID
ncbi:MAG: sugar ABC transporter [Psychromonas sp.]|nr:sugar ABC transporter [Alteromonadales bacterium]MCP5077811.1 sugar ABC transporter [Psychromonas sp.]